MLLQYSADQPLLLSRWLAVCDNDETDQLDKPQFTKSNLYPNQNNVAL